MRSSRTARQASVLSQPMFLIASNTFWPSARTPMTTSSEIALRSSRTRTTVPSRDQPYDRLRAASGRAFQASQAPFTFRHTRLTRSLVTVPPKQGRKRSPQPGGWLVLN